MPVSLCELGALVWGAAFGETGAALQFLKGYVECGSSIIFVQINAYLKRRGAHFGRPSKISGLSCAVDIIDIMAMCAL